MYGDLVPNRLFVGGIPLSVNYKSYNLIIFKSTNLLYFKATECELKEYFTQLGQVKDARIITNPKGTPKGYVYVTNLFLHRHIHIQIFNLCAHV